MLYDIFYAYELYASTVWIVVMKRYDSCLLSSATPPSESW
jgi:hypothetical protein